MRRRINEILDRIRALDKELQIEFEKIKTDFHFKFENHKIRFEQEYLRRHKQLKMGLVQYFIESRPLSVLTAPIIYSMIIPILILDVTVSIYQLICFPAYGIPFVKRKDYFVFDRRHLAYLNIVEKINCAYCSYGNCLINYTREVFARTEQYWCPIKHAERIIGAHERYSRFLDYGDAEGYKSELENIRKSFEEIKVEVFNEKTK